MKDGGNPDEGAGGYTVLIYPPFLDSVFSGIFLIKVSSDHPGPGGLLEVQSHDLIVVLLTESAF